MASTRDVIRLLESGKNVVTPVGWIYPADTPGCRRAPGRVPRRARRRCTAPGINPGGITERFPLMLSALCRDIRHVRAEEFSDIRNYPTDMVVREVMLFGKDPETAAKSPMVEILGHGFMQSIDMVCAELGLDARRREDARSTSGRSRRRDIDTPVGVIEKGTVAAQRFTWEGTVDGEPVMTVRVNWLMGSENLDPPWTLGEQRFEVEFDADAAGVVHVPRPAPAGRRRAPRDRSDPARRCTA